MRPLPVYSDPLKPNDLPINHELVLTSNKKAFSPNEIPALLVQGVYPGAPPGEFIVDGIVRATGAGDCEPASEMDLSRFNQVGVKLGLEPLQFPMPIREWNKYERAINGAAVSFSDEFFVLKSEGKIQREINKKHYMYICAQRLHTAIECKQINLQDKITFMPPDNRSLNEPIGIDDDRLPIWHHSVVIVLPHLIEFAKSLGIKVTLTETQSSEAVAPQLEQSTDAIPEFSTKRCPSAEKLIQVITIAMLRQEFIPPVSGKYAESLLKVLLEVYGTMDKIPKAPTLRKEIEKRITRLEVPISERESLISSLPSRNPVKALLDHLAAT